MNTDFEIYALTKFSNNLYTYMYKNVKFTGRRGSWL